MFTSSAASTEGGRGLRTTRSIRRFGVAAALLLVFGTTAWAIEVDITVEAPQRPGRRAAERR